MGFGRHSSLARSTQASAAHWLAGSGLLSREVIGREGRMRAEPALKEGVLNANLMPEEKELI